MAKFDGWSYFMRIFNGWSYSVDKVKMEDVYGEAGSVVGPKIVGKRECFKLLSDIWSFSTRKVSQFLIAGLQDYLGLLSCISFNGETLSWWSCLRMATCFKIFRPVFIVLLAQKKKDEKGRQ